MKKLFGVLLLTIVVCTFTFADGFLSVHSGNGLDVWAVGINGNVFHSVDGGGTWSSLTQGTGTLRSVYTLGNAVWMVGDNGKCFTSTNNGSTWTEQTLNGGNSVNGVLLIDSQTGFVVGNGGAILKTINGGTTWEAKSSSTTQKLNTIAFADAQVGYVVGAAGVVLRSTNGGDNWTGIGGSGWTKDITSIAVNGSTIYVTGGDAFCAKSVNGGSTWTVLNFTTDSQSDVNGVFAKNANEAVFVGGGGYVRVTNNGGSSFTWGRHSLHGTLNSVFFHDNMNAWACSEKSNVVLRTTDGGLN
ncbi:MAG: YCF48-related protein, partial [Bacteroidota bacterium]